LRQQIELTKNYFIEIYNHTTETSLRHKSCKGMTPPGSGSDIQPFFDGGHMNKNSQHCIYCDHTFDTKICTMYKLWKFHNNR